MITRGTFLSGLLAPFLALIPRIRGGESEGLGIRIDEVDMNLQTSFSSMTITVPEDEELEPAGSYLRGGQDRRYVSSSEIRDPDAPPVTCVRYEFTTPEGFPHWEHVEVFAHGIASGHSIVIVRGPHSPITPEEARREAVRYLG